MRASGLGTVPNTAFGIALGLGGNAILWRTASEARFLDVGRSANWIVWVVGCVAWVFFAGCLLVKMWTNCDFALCEWLHPTRCYFSFAPHLALTMLAIGSPQSLDEALRPLRTAVFLAGLLAQSLACVLVYARWLFSPVDGDLGHASPPYLLSTVGWPLLCVLSQALHLERRWDLDVPSLCFGPGAAWYSLAFVTIVQTMHSRRRTHKGAPVLFLIIAPPSVMAVALDNFNASGPSTAVFGFAFFTALVLARLGPKLLARPSTLGYYWAYVFPLAALASAGLRVAENNGKPARVLARGLLAVATATLVAVFLRMSVHLLQVARGRALWVDPLLNLSESHHRAIVDTFCKRPRPRDQTTRQDRTDDRRGSAPDDFYVVEYDDDDDDDQEDDIVKQQRRQLADVAKGPWAGTFIPTTPSTSSLSSSGTSQRRRHPSGGGAKDDDETNPTD